MYPTILKFGRVELHSYGLLLAIAFLVGIQLFLKRGVKRGLSEEKLSALSLLLLVLAIVGGRGLFVLTHWSDYARDPAGVFRIWEGGLMLYTSFSTSDLGAFVGPFEKKYGIKVTHWRSSSENVLQRAVTEARAGRYEVDAF